MDISQLGASGAVVIVVIYFLRYMSNESKKRDESHDKLVESIDRNTEVTQETYTYLKHRNGTLERLIREQPELHRIVKEHRSEQ